MAPPKRRSSRLRSQTPQAEEASIATTPVKKLPTFVEQDEDAPNNKTMASHAGPVSKKTPTSTAKFRASPQEMHPEYYQSTAKKAASVKRLGALSQTPTKGDKGDKGNVDEDLAATNPFSSPTFSFQFQRPVSGLSSEAQKLLSDIRGEAEAIMQDLQAGKESSDDPLHPSARRIAQPKGRSGRFSNAHTEEFSKMTSIANHPSAFRADPNRMTPTSGKSLKRTMSKTDLESSPRRTDSSSNDSAPQSPTKRVKPNTSSNLSSPSRTITISPSKSGLPVLSSKSPLATPTKSSLARSNSVRSLKSDSKIAGFTQTPSRTGFGLFSAATEGKKPRGSFVNRLTQVKSILKKPQLRFSDDPVKIAAGTHVSTPQRAKKLDFNKDLPSLPAETPGSPSHRQEKHVNFSSSTKDEHPPSDPPQLSPTPAVTYPVVDPASPLASTKKPRSTFEPRDFTFRANQALAFGLPPSTPTIRAVPPQDSVSVPTGVKLSDLPKIPHGFSNKKRKRDSEDVEMKDEQADKENTSQQSSKRTAHTPADGSPTKRIKMTITPSTPKSSVRKPPTTPKTDSRVQRRPAGLAALGIGPRTPRSTVRPGAAAKVSASVGAKKPGIMSLSRLNALAQPKLRQ